MKKIALLLLALWICAAAASAKEIVFVDTYDHALSAAKENNSKILIKFYTDWCMWCKKLDTTAYRNDSVIAVIGNMVNVRVNAEKDTLLARKYGIAGYPTIVLTNADGSEIDRIYGYLEPPDFVQAIRDYLVGKNTLADYLQRIEKEPSIDLYFTLADKYVGRSKFAEAESCYRKIIDGDPENKQGRTDSSYYALGDLKRRAKDFTGAIAAFKEYIARYPKLDGAVDAELDIASCYIKMGSKDEAVKVYQQYLVNHPNSSDTAYVKKQIDKILNPPKEEKK